MNHKDVSFEPLETYADLAIQGAKPPSDPVEDYPSDWMTFLTRHCGLYIP